jgi:oxygen-insensitive NAD(P)H nitroreductase
MDAIQNLMTRRSVKKFKPDMVPADILDKIIKAGTNAPSGMNRQSSIILAVTNKQMRDKLSKMNAAVMGSNNDPFYGAPVVLVVLADKSIGTYKYDGSLVMGNLLNAAHALGVSSCWIHRAKEVFDSAEGKQILYSLGIVGDYEGIGNCILGYADCDIPAAKERKKNYVYFIK